MFTPEGSQLFMHHKSWQLLEAMAQIEHVFMKRKPKKFILSYHAVVQIQEGGGLDLYANCNQKRPRVLIFSF